MKRDLTIVASGTMNSFNRQIHGILPISVLSRERTGSIDDDFDLASLLHDAVDILIDGGIIEGVNHGCVRPAALSRNLQRHCFNAWLGAARQKLLRLRSQTLWQRHSRLSRPR